MGLCASFAAVTTLAELGEFEVIRRLDAVRRRGRGVTLGPGDDAAVLAPESGRELVVTTDTFVEGRHFDPAWCSPADAGRRLAIANLSDVVAMGARPRWAVRSTTAGGDRDVEELVAFEKGLSDTLADEGVAIVGGNLTSSSGAASFTLTLIGDVDAGRAVTRAGANVGDAVYVRGHAGHAGAGYRLAHSLGERARAANWRQAIDAWVRPDVPASLPQSAELTAAIDISDGLAADLHHLCVAGDVGALLDLDASPIDPFLVEAAAALAMDPIDLLLGPSDDYVPLVTAAAGALDDEGFARIGTITDETGVIVVRFGGATRAIEPPRLRSFRALADPPAGVSAL